MNAIDFPYLTHETDKALLPITPTLMQPRFGTLPELEIGSKRYVMASDGVYVQARTKALSLTLKIHTMPVPMPYGELKESVILDGGLIPLSIIDKIKHNAINACPNEYAAIVLYDSESTRYTLHEPVINSASAGHIQYQTKTYDDEDVVLDIHSHGELNSYFSATDDQSDFAGIQFSSVLGHCRDLSSITTVSRICIDGFFYPLEWNPWEEE